MAQRRAFDIEYDDAIATVELLGPGARQCHGP